MKSTLQVYNTLTRKKEPFQPLHPPYVGMYVCGPTLYNELHMGNLLTFIRFDVIFRYLKHLGYKVRYVRNITDVGHLLNDSDGGEDKVETQARLENLEPMEIVQKYTVGFHQLMHTFNCLPPSVEPTATGHIIEQIEMVQRILKNGFAYEKNGSVYFDVLKYNESNDYGKLSGRKIEELFSETRELSDQAEKKNPQDFAIWKSTGDDKIMKWNSPWGYGVPGWHLECSVMSTKYLGEQFDIHGGGMDLKFPHHECEIAQSVGADGLDPVKYWLHGNMLTVNGAKMSKSLNNSIWPAEIIAGTNEVLSKAFDPMVVRFFMMQAHYSSELDISNDALVAAEKGYFKLMEAYKTLNKIEPKGKALSEQVDLACATCWDLMNDDFNTPRTIAQLFVITTIINKAATSDLSLSTLDIELLEGTMHGFIFDVLGLDEPSGNGNNEVTEGLMEMVLTLRADARTNKDWTTSDLIRDRLKALNIVVKDGKEGTSWTIGS